jgi:hypothetical protein
LCSRQTWLPPSWREPGRRAIAAHVWDVMSPNALRSRRISSDAAFHPVIDSLGSAEHAEADVPHGHSGPPMMNQPIGRSATIDSRPTGEQFWDCIPPSRSRGRRVRGRWPPSIGRAVGVRPQQITDFAPYRRHDSTTRIMDLHQCRRLTYRRCDRRARAFHQHRRTRPPPASTASTNPPCQGSGCPWPYRGTASSPQELPPRSRTQGGRSFLDGCR